MKMPKKAMESLTESMFYVLMALMRRPMCGIEAVRFVSDKTAGRISIGPATGCIRCLQSSKAKAIIEKLRLKAESAHTA